MKPTTNTPQSVPDYTEQVKAIIQAKKDNDNWDCDESQSAEIKQWIKNTIPTGADESQQILEDILELFPIEWEEAIDEQDKFIKD